MKKGQQNLECLKSQKKSKNFERLKTHKNCQKCRISTITKNGQKI